MFRSIKNIAMIAARTSSKEKTIRGTAITAGFGGLTMWSEYHTTGKEYGQGAAALKTAIYMAPTGIVGGLAIAGAEMGYHLGNHMYKTQMNKRKSSFGQGFKDPFGNAATMRQRSQYVLQRGRASLGSEARLFH